MGEKDAPKCVHPGPFSERPQVLRSQISALMELDPGASYPSGGMTGDPLGKSTLLPTWEKEDLKMSR
jgi:hypothetical protein